MRSLVDNEVRKIQMYINVFVSLQSCIHDSSRHLETVLRGKVVNNPTWSVGRGLSPSSIKPLGNHFHWTFTQRFVTHLFTMWLLILAGKCASLPSSFFFFFFIFYFHFNKRMRILVFILIRVNTTVEVDVCS